VWCSSPDLALVRRLTTVLSFRLAIVDAAGKTALGGPHGARIVAVTQAGLQAAAVDPTVRVASVTSATCRFENRCQPIPVLVGGRWGRRPLSQAKPSGLSL
jgi:hypothetical protein